MANFIEAQVIQKIATEQEWNTDNRILYKGELGLVSSAGKVVNIKVGDGINTFANCQYMYNGGFSGSVTPTTNGTSLTNGFYIANGAGTYTNMGGLVVRAGYLTIISKVGTTYTIASEVNLTKVYTAGSGVDITNDKISVKVDGTTIKVNAAGLLEVIGGGGGISAIVTDNTNKSVQFSGDGTQSNKLSAEVKIDNATIKKRADGTLYSEGSGGSGGGITQVATDNTGNVKFSGNGTNATPLKADVDLSNLVVKETGKGLSTNDYTTAEKTKLAGLSNYNLATASATTKGGAKIPTTSSISISSENIDVKIDGTTITKGLDGTLSAVSSGGGGSSNITTYVHSGNKEVTVSSINYTTNTLTSNAHGLANGDRVAFNISSDCNILTQTPFSNGWNVDSTTGGYYVVGVTTNTFQLSLTSGGTAIALTERATNDFTKWKIEVMPSSTGVAFNNLNGVNIRLSIVGGVFKSVDTVIVGSAVFNGYKDGVIGANHLGREYGILGMTEISVNLSNGQDYIKCNHDLIKLSNSVTSLLKNEVFVKNLRPTPITVFPTLSLNGLKPMNGTRIILEKLV